MAQRQGKRRPPPPQGRAAGYIALALGAAALLSVLALAAVRHGMGGGVVQGLGMKTYAEGDWISDFNGYHAVFQTHGGTYQILAVYGDPVTRRYYSRGTATLRGNLLTLTPSGAMGAPESRDYNTPYKDLTSGTFIVTLRRQGDDLLWLAGPPDPSRANLNPAHPLIQYSGRDAILWTPKR